MFVDFGEFGADGKVHGVVVFVDVYKEGTKIKPAQKTMLPIS